MAKLYAVPESSSNKAEVFLGDYTFETAYDYLAELDSDWDNPFMPGYDFVITDGVDRYILEADCWAPLEKN
jgi:hypothetical protein